VPLKLLVSYTSVRQTQGMGKGTRATAGHMPLTHHERTKKFTIHSTTDSADYGTTSLRLAGHSQYQIGTCALTTQLLLPSLLGSTSTGTSSSGTSTSTTSSIALCSPSGYIYDETSILEYLLLQTQQIKQRQQQQEKIKHQTNQEQIINELNAKKRQIEQFDESQRIIKKSSSMRTEQEKAMDDLHRVSYWLSTAQPVVDATTALSKTSIPTKISKGNQDNTVLALTNGGAEETHNHPHQIPTNVKVAATSNLISASAAVVDSTTTILPERPGSPMTGQPLVRRDLWPIQLEWTTPSTGVMPKVKCAISDRVISNGAPVVAYWTTKKPYLHSTENDNDHNQNLGVMVLQSVYEKELRLSIPPPSDRNHPNSSKSQSRCPITDRTIRHVRILQRSGSSYAASGQNIMSAKQYKPTIT
jgi:hypothetical protein